ncbi:MAG: 23S rRNA (adenine(2503)-C(2))-methyltransferase RlmN [Alphaproteobacteria bacterium]|nr:23S rRNA (adenine(2503)-C(2))-methyltransferase RlmN [Alphaproteobacteria bacterium]
MTTTTAPEAVLPTGANKPEIDAPQAPLAARADGRRNLVGLTRGEIAAAMTALGEKPFRAQQIWRWIYVRGATSFEGMTDISKALRARLEERFYVFRPAISRHQTSTDGTQKWLLRMEDGAEIECVHIPESDRGTLCVSSQVGCTLTCKFCHTGTQRLVRNLEATEIVAQLLSARDALGEWPPPEQGRKLTNIVLMGMGEPLFNYDNVARAMSIARDPEGFGLSRRKITLSTSGVVPMIRRCGAEMGIMLAISLHAVSDELRDHLVPINKKWPIAELMAACRDYPGLSNARRITFEYVMLKDVNDSLADARALVKLIDGIPAKVNLIPFNPWPGSSFECSSWDQIEKFSDVVAEAGYTSPVRRPRGRDILAACGQLKSDTERARRTHGA